MGSGNENDAAAGPSAHLDGDGIVARPALVSRLGGPARVTVLSAPPGSGKTVLLRSWITGSGRARDVAWVPGGYGERDPQRFWLSVVAALRSTGPGAALVRGLTAAPDLDGWAVTERLLADLESADDRMWLVIDDVHELEQETLRQLELLVHRAPPALRFVLATRHDLRLGLHRLRLEGELTEISAPELRFTLAEARNLLEVAGIQLSEPTLALLHERTEGWAAGLRLAALSLAGHPDPERFAAEFSGTDRTVAEYLLAEVLDRQGEQVRRLLLRTSVAERVNGELADLLTGDVGGERILQDLERANAFVVSLDPARSWFRYHQMFASLLRLELRRTDPGEVTALHQAASGWFAARGYPVEAIRHAQEARDWPTAIRLLADHWPGLYLGGQGGVIHELLARFPAEAPAADAELAALAAVDELTSGSLETAEQYLGLAAQRQALVPDGHGGQTRLLLGVAGLLLARQRGNLPAAAEEVRRLQAMAEAPDTVQPDRDPARPGLGEDLRALALISLGSTEFWVARFGDASRHLADGIALARKAGRPYLEFTGLAYQALLEVFRSYARATEYGTRAVELARRHGWTGEPADGVARVALGSVLAWQGRLDEAEPWIRRAERSLRAEAEPAASLAVHYVRGILDLARGRDADALADFRAAERLALLAGQDLTVTAMRAFALQALVRLGETERAEQELARLGEQERGHEAMRIAVAALRLVQNDPQAAVAALAPLLEGSAPRIGQSRLVDAFLVEAIARDALGDPGAAESALERALDLAEPDWVLVWFLLYPVPGMLERHARHHTLHAALIAEILALLAGRKAASPAGGSRPLPGPLSESEIRVLRYLPTNLTVPEIAGELSLSPNTVKTHVRNLYSKLGIRRRTEAVARGRDLGLLAPSARGVG